MTIHRTKRCCKKAANFLVKVGCFLDTLSKSTPFDRGSNGWFILLEELLAPVAYFHHRDGMFVRPYSSIRKRTCVAMSVMKHARPLDLSLVFTFYNVETSSILEEHGERSCWPGVMAGVARHM